MGGEWQVAHCDERLPFVCEYDPAFATKKGASPLAQAFSAWIDFFPYVSHGPLTALKVFGDDEYLEGIQPRWVL